MWVLQTQTKMDDVKREKNHSDPVLTPKLTLFFIMSYLCIKTPTCSAVEEGAEQLDLRLQFSQPEVNWLVVEDGLLEDLPLPRVLDGLLNDVVHHGQDWRRQDREVEMWLLCSGWDYASCHLFIVFNGSNGVSNSASDLWYYTQKFTGPDGLKHLCQIQCKQFHSPK